MKEIIKVIERGNRTPALISQLVEVWERSVRETHLFLSDEEILQIRECVSQTLSGGRRWPLLYMRVQVVCRCRHVSMFFT